MNVLTYHSAKKQIIFMALYFVITGIVIRLIGYSLQESLSFFSQASLGNFLSGDISLEGAFQIDFDFSQFDGLSFNTWLVYLEEQIHSFLESVMPTTLGAANLLMLSQYVTAENAVKLGLQLY